MTYVTSQFGGSSCAIDVKVGDGLRLEEGSRYTISYKVADFNGKMLANSDSRGLPYSKELGDGHDRYFDAWVQGMNAGGLRQIVLAAEDVPKELGGLIPTHGDLVITVRLLGVRQPRPR
jgi:FKBP-type peptidyl-prolyl cis-trans isomerase